MLRLHAGLMKFTGRPLTGFVLVAGTGIATRAALKKWIDETVLFALSLPKKKRKPRTSERARPRR